MSSSDLGLIDSGRWARGVKGGKGKRRQKGRKKMGRKGRNRKKENVILMPHSEYQVMAVTSFLSLTLTHF